MTTTNQRAIIEAVIESQSKIIGPIAYELAQATGCVTIDNHKHITIITPDFTTALSQIASVYENHFGPIALKISGEAIHNLHLAVDRTQLPPSLWY